MTQEAVVTKVLPNGMAEVAVRRTTACGGNCASCDSCVFERELKTLAKNTVQAAPGQKVLIESQTSKVFGAAILVYILPLILFLCGYLLASLFGLNEPGCIVVSFLALLVGAAIVVLSQKRRRAGSAITFEIVEFI